VPKETFFNISKEKQGRIISAAVNEFAEYRFSEAKLSRIIKDSKIPRGSFYQYFEDKRDIYIFLFERIRDRKLEYMADLLPNPEKTPFLVLFKELYIRGLKFAMDNPRYVLISSHLVHSRGDIFKELMGDNLAIAKNFYVNYIETDKKLGRIRNDVDSELLADLIIDATTAIAVDQIRENVELDVEKMTKRIDGMLQILQKGII
jgi:AcrR family transcriptional regulator